ncbi:hypothetical protein [Nitratireductor soli]|uniref:hypothetical protein n=1 Tax=Nitratireductor soli TaxID=1670619 RepID=UPI00065E8817|nr:hypothetical protein [Nitratireductor soli]
MADFSAVLKKTIDALADNSPAAREKIYQKARTTIEAKLAAITPPPPAAVVERQRKLLDDAIASVEAGYAEPEPIDTVDEDELEHVFAELDVDPIRPAVPVPPPPAASSYEPAAAAAPVAPSLAPPAPEEPAIEEKGDAPAPASPAPADDDGVPEDEAFSGREARVNAPLAGSSRPRRKGSSGLAAGIVLLVLAAVAAGAWLYRDDLSRLANFENAPQTETDSAAATPETDRQANTSTDGAPAQNASSDDGDAEQPPATQRPSKFTQRLTPDGQEIDEGPAGGSPGLGEGTSVAQATAPGSGEASPGATTPPANAGSSNGTNASAQQQSLPVGQKAIFYEERTNVSQGSADPGAVVWSVVQESPGNDLPPEPAIRAEATIPAKNLQLKMTIRRNADESLPASHIAEIIFLTPDDFDGGGVDNVLRVSMKRSEQDTGSPLLGIPAKIADGFFLVALSDSKADIETNTLLLRRQSWIDIPVVYKSGRRALITIERGIPGDKIFTDVLNAWQNSSSG